jgi:hypothetical protein
MTWKRCEGCTRAISSAAFTCEYCGHLCDDVLGGLPTEGSDQAGLAWPPEDPRPDSAASLIEDDSPQGLPALELKPSFPFTEAVDEAFSDEALADVALPDAASSDEASASDGPFFLDEEPAVVTTDVLHEAAPASAAATAAPLAARPAKPPVGPRQVAMMGGALVATSALIFTILSMRPSASPEPVAQTAAPAPARKPAANRAATAAARTSGTPASTPLTPKWNQVTAGRWTGGDRKSVAFELQANNKIHIWTRDVTPVLVVRCRGGQVEPFVYTQSAARMEPQDGDHTVRVAFDDGPEVSERWPDSDEHDALFARDSAAFTHQLASAQTLRFGFEPHNAGPAVTQFDVSGLNELLAAAAKPCGWKH